VLGPSFREDVSAGKKLAEAPSFFISRALSTRLLENGPALLL